MTHPEADNGDFRASQGGRGVPGNPGGGDSIPPDTIENGLRALARDAGPNVSKLLADEPGIRAIMDAAKAPPGWLREEKAAAVLALVRSLTDKIRNPRWRTSAQAALRTPPERFTGAEFDTLHGRWREVSRRDGELPASVDDAVEKLRGYWRTSAAQHLAALLSDRLAELSMDGGLALYRRGDPQPPPLSLPISFERTEVLYRFQGYRGVDSTSYRWLRAHGDVDHYEAVGWYYNEPDAPVEITPLANCVLDGPLQDLPQGGRCGKLRFARTLSDGDRYFFAYSTRFNSQKDCRPAILYEVRGLRMDVLTVRAQFDPPAVPELVWFFDVASQSDGRRAPEPGSPELLPVADNGFVEHEFTNCVRGRKYGLRWVWANGRSESVGEG